MKFQAFIFIFILNLAPWSKANTPDGLNDFLQGFVHCSYEACALDFYFDGVDVGGDTRPTAGPQQDPWRYPRKR